MANVFAFSGIILIIISSNWIFSTGTQSRKNLVLQVPVVLDILDNLKDNIGQSLCFLLRCSYVHNLSKGSL